MKLEEYKAEYIKKYKSYCKYVRNLIKQMIDELGMNVQAVQGRVKKYESLKDKLVLKNLIDCNAVESKIKDLAGCRIIVYYNNDTRKILRSTLIKKYFHVIKGSYKRHFISEEIKSSNECYVAEHVVVELLKSRDVNIYEKFKNMKCELQVQTVLNHAFSETNHDIIYKKKIVEGYDEGVVAEIERKLIHLVENHLIPAGHQLQKIYDEYCQVKVVARR